jgi:hypothetical protein
VSEGGEGVGENQWGTVMKGHEVMRCWLVGRMGADNVGGGLMRN